MSALDHFRLLRADARTEIHDLTLDSRTAGEGSLFLALHGAREDGADYAKEAAARGAVCVVTEHAAEGVPCVLVPDAHEAAAKLAARWYGDPAGRMTVVGVTGTNGKTTTTYLLKQLLERCLGAKVGLIGTNQNMIGDAVLSAERTTPDALTLQRLLREMADAGCTHVVMEVSSHARVLVVFGCGGDRDRTKRAEMGRIAARLADEVIVTSDNPRTENPYAILHEILAGMADSATPFAVLESRREAIAYALDHARTGDVVVLAGKGHETYQVVGAETLPLDERQVVREHLSQ